MIINEKYDCVVVGGGPAGSTFAYEAATKGLDVLVLDKRQAIGEPVRCGEGVGDPIFEAHNIPRNKDFCAQRILGWKIISPKGKVFTHANAGGYVVDRFLFDKFIAIRAAKAGATIISNAQVTNVLREGELMNVKFTFLGEKHQVQASIVIGADGRESNVARWLGINTTLPLTSIDKGFQYDLITPTETPKFLRVYIGKKIAPNGYVWIFPKGSHRMNIGIGVAGDAPETAKYYLDKFMAKNGIKGSVIQHISGTIPLTPPKHPVHADNLMLIGDAARFVNPVHGGGIDNAMNSGRFAAYTAFEAFEKGDFSQEALADYEKKLTEQMKDLKNLSKVKNIITALSDEELDYMFDKLDENFMNDIVSGKGFGRMIKLFLGKPSLLRFMAMLR